MNTNNETNQLRELSHIEDDLINELAANGTDKARDLFLEWQNVKTKRLERVVNKIEEMVAKDNCGYCGRSEPCEGSYPEGCLHDTLQSQSLPAEPKGELKESQIVQILGFHEAWPLRDVLSKLVESTEYLLNVKNYDGHGWEEVLHCTKRGREIIALLHKVNPAQFKQPSQPESKTLEEIAAERFPIHEDMSEQEKYAVYSRRNGFYIGVEYANQPRKEGEQEELWEKAIDLIEVFADEVSTIHRDAINALIAQGYVIKRRNN